MKSAPRSYYHNRGGFSLVELLVVIAIIAILAGILLPVLGRVQTRAQITKANSEMQGVVAAINQYYAEYSRFPASSEALNSVNVNWPDFTFGTMHRQGGSTVRLTGADGSNLPEIRNGNTGYQASNAEVMIILGAVTHLTDASGNSYETVNANHGRNPRRIQFYDVSRLDHRGLLLDPWGNPYIISMDFNHDNRTRDAFYSRAGVSQESGDRGLNGLSRSQGNPADSFELPGTVMMWSFGPDGQADNNTRANAGVNRDNVLSWGN